MRLGFAAAFVTLTVVTSSFHSLTAHAAAADKKVELGKQLFFDPRLSLDGSISCNSCHNVMLGGEDNRAFSMGVKGQLGGRSSPTVWNSKFNSVQFWDGRAASLEEQAKGPLTNPVEMAMPNHDVVVSRVVAIPGYRKQFASVYGAKEKITIDAIADSIAAFEKTLVTLDSPYDKYKKGNKSAMTAQQIKGMQRFESAGCVACHSGNNFHGPDLPQGTGFYMKFPTYAASAYVEKYKLMGDTGRSEVTKKDEDKHMWRVPSLRNVALTAPYFHNGSVDSLQEAVKVMAKVQLDKDLTNDEADELVAFLESLTGPRPKIEAPQLPVLSGKVVTTIQ